LPVSNQCCPEQIHAPRHPQQCHGHIDGLLKTQPAGTSLQHSSHRLCLHRDHASTLTAMRLFRVTHLPILILLLSYKMPDHKHLYTADKCTQQSISYIMVALAQVCSIPYIGARLSKSAYWWRIHSPCTLSPKKISDCYN